MTEEYSPPQVEEDPFAESDEWLAAEVRQLFRAYQVADAKAVEVTLFYFEHYLTLTLRRHLRKRDPHWADPIRWIDGLGAEPEFLAPGRLRLRGSASWVYGQKHWYWEPFDFEIELCPNTMAFRWYVFRFGDHRPLEAKEKSDAVSTVPVGGWAYEIERRRPEVG